MAYYFQSSLHVVETFDHNVHNNHILYLTFTGRGIYVIGFSYPVVPKGEARIRVQLSASHSLDDVDRAVDAFIEIGRKLKVVQ